MKPEIGQILYSLNINNAARNREQSLKPVKVTKVGRKYFSCAEEGSSWETVYHIDNWRQKTEYTPDSCLYSSTIEWEQKKEANDLHKKIKEEINTYSKQPSLDKLRKISAILFG